MTTLGICVNKYFKKFMDSIHTVKVTTLTVEKKPVILDLLYFGSLSLKIRKNNFVGLFLLFYNYLTFFDDFSILILESQNFYQNCLVNNNGSSTYL